MLALLIAFTLFRPACALQGPEEGFVLDLADPSTFACPLTFVNSTERPVEIWLAGFWPNHKVSILDGQGKAVVPTPKGVEAEARFGSLARDKNLPFTVDPGARYKYQTPPLPSFFRLAPGKYSMTVCYWEKVEGAQLRVQTQSIRVVVKDSRS